MSGLSDAEKFKLQRVNGDYCDDLFDVVEVIVAAHVAAALNAAADEIEACAARALTNAADNAYCAAARIVRAHT